MSDLILRESIESKIFLIRSKRVMLDKDLAQLYGVPTKSLNLAVKRNSERFPEDFIFRLNNQEYKNLRFQIETSKRGGRRYLPYAFTENGVAMLSSVLNSKRAIQVNIQIMRAFTKLREYLSTHKELAANFKEVETRIDKQDEKIQSIIEAINYLLHHPEKQIQIKGFKKT